MKAGQLVKTPNGKKIVCKAQGNFAVVVDLDCVAVADLRDKLEVYYVSDCEVIQE